MVQLRLFAACASAALTVALAASTAQAQPALPSGPVTIVVPFTPGGANDVTARLLAPELSKAIDRSVVVENRPGAGGNIGVGFVARAKPDGSTLLISSASSHVFAYLAKADPSYDPRTSFAAIGILNDVPLVLSAWPGLGVKTVTDLLKIKKELFFGSSGTGSSPHFAGELFAARTGMKITHVPYQGGAQALNDLTTGRIELAWLTLPSALAQAKAGTILNLGVSSEHRAASEPDLKTVQEQGVYDYSVGSWTGLFAPAQTPPELVAYLGSILEKLSRDETFQAHMRKVGTEPLYLGPAETDAFVRKEFDRWIPVVQKITAAAK
ncbi:MAG TPA: tripartite tricarboxylate transporter substrate binding protein [Beijerinckiaceae bacterium]|nr:tripartite tricarboxylate transporter substrate binding protein [Beijerinckiaceae bacterium]